MKKPRQTADQGRKLSLLVSSVEQKIKEGGKLYHRRFTCISGKEVEELIFLNKIAWINLMKEVTKAFVGF